MSVPYADLVTCSKFKYCKKLERPADDSNDPAKSVQTDAYAIY